MGQGAHVMDVNRLPAARDDPFDLLARMDDEAQEEAVVQGRRRVNDSFGLRRS